MPDAPFRASGTGRRQAVSAPYPLSMPLWKTLRWYLLLAAIVGGHVAMWLSPRVPPEEALRLTLTNAAIWAVVLLPALGVHMWARAHRCDARRDGDG